MKTILCDPFLQIGSLVAAEDKANIGAALPEHLHRTFATH